VLFAGRAPVAPPAEVKIFLSSPPSRPAREPMPCPISLPPPPRGTALLAGEHFQRAQQYLAFAFSPR